METLIREQTVTAGTEAAAPLAESIASGWQQIVELYVNRPGQGRDTPETRSRRIGVLGTLHGLGDQAQALSAKEVAELYGIQLSYVEKIRQTLPSELRRLSQDNGATKEAEDVLEQIGKRRAPARTRQVGAVAIRRGRSEAARKKKKPAAMAPPDTASSEDDTRAYLNEISRTALLNAEEEADLAKRYAAGEEAKKCRLASARHQLR